MNFALVKIQPPRPFLLHVDFYALAITRKFIVRV